MARDRFKTVEIDGQVKLQRLDGSIVGLDHAVEIAEPDDTSVRLTVDNDAPSVDKKGFRLRPLTYVKLFLLLALALFLVNKNLYISELENKHEDLKQRFAFHLSIVDDSGQFICDY